MALGMVLLLGSCGSDDSPGTTNQDASTPRPDTRTVDQSVPVPDTRTTTPDFAWPDTSSNLDSWPVPDQGYTGSSFGCESDADCFGQRCCPTPWGVKVCADDCPQATP